MSATVPVIDIAPTVEVLVRGLNDVARGMEALTVSLNELHREWMSLPEDVRRKLWALSQPCPPTTTSGVG